MKLKQLKDVLADGSFHHATYRNVGTLWEGLWIYVRDESSWGFDSFIVFYKDELTLSDAEKMVSGTGISLGSYGQG